MEPVEDPGTAGSYPSSWEADVVLRDGHTIRVRPIVPDDGDRLLRFHERQSAESVYYRYFSPRPRLSQRDVRHLTHVDHADRVAFVALSGDEMIGVARYERYRGTDTAEVAFFVDDAHHGRGLATLLLEYLAAAAQERQLRRFSATTLPSNRRMLGVFAAAGYDVASRLDEGVVEVSFDIDPTGDSLAAMDRRERAAESASVRPMLAPASVAVVGAGRHTGTLGADVVANLVANGFAGSLAAVNRNVGSAGGALHGVATVGSVEQLPEGLDLVVIATPAHEVPDVVDACGVRGARSVVVLSAGFAESGPRGAELERDALEAARRHGMRLLGPNCLGLINTDRSVRLNATLAPELPPPGRIGMLAEAGILSASILEHARRTGLGLSTMVAAGNRADVSATDLLSYWIDDEATDAVLLYLAARNLQPRFVRAARAASLRLPVAALHTSMATPADARRRSPDADRRAAAMFRQTGVMSVASLGQLFDLGRLLSDQPVPAGPGVAVIGNSDGAIALAADACVGAGLDLVEMEVYSEAGRVLRNPVDLTHRADAEAFADAIAAVTSDERVHSVVVVATPPRLDWDAELADVVLDASERSPSITFTATLLGAADRTRVSREGVTGRGDVAVPIFPFPEDAARALGSVADYRGWLASVDPGAEMATGVGSEQAARATAVVDAAGDRRRAAGEEYGLLELGEQDELLDAYGVEVIERRAAPDVDAAVAAAEELGWPVALKAATRDRLTRSASSGVVLDIASEAQLRDAWGRVESALGAAMHPVAIQRFADSGIDVAIEVRRDPDGSGTVEVGLGGPAAILGEYELRVLPLTLADASALVAGSPVGRVLTDPLDRVPIVDVVHRLSDLVLEEDAIRRLVADPIVVSPMSAAVADVEIVVGEPIEDFAVRRLE